MLRRRSRRPDPQAVRVWAVCSALLDYPTPDLVDSLDDLEALVPGHAQLVPLIEHARRTPLDRLQQNYVATFDHTRKCALYLTYFAYGDTRRRGAALLGFKDAYRRAGVEWDDALGELPDHLCAVLQLGATVDAEVARTLLLEHRAGVEMLRLALTGWRNDDGSTGSPWAAALVALCDTLPELAGTEADAVRRLVEQGPPAEEVGLAGYAADPALTGGPALISSATIPVGAPR
ncbi:nitrate reductase molybdenum cofactor assembly chaperone [Nocardioides sp. zg-1228]|uniref:nitrate reductase molybdenum cofactor assembly chaperone n=1 Tax=Nocardioides sp. zg-1228 TaxID=2763008 RepID=UPI00164277F8|nr:nitrate reductase molybdenum cofactor assembly chaperone [Nocardioides sp. zg-1228]MBC2932804.1 nitrate reductase molybdenum cofactor assembly chaperone [Nocardioides sp. zg-1228]QSF58275.1 nitrate reductase molybdenum cofactor assembly chaperone [Nocardioides sp. zg-1228]